jgi:hypothetical protein
MEQKMEPKRSDDGLERATFSEREDEVDTTFLQILW